MKNIPTKANLSGGDDSGTATKFGAKELNSIADELENFVVSTGETPSPGTSDDPDTDMISRGITIASQTAHSYQDSGAANAYVLTGTGTIEQPTSYIEGMRITFVTANENTGASTVNVSGLGVKAMVKAGDVALSAGDISENIYMGLIYDPAADSASGGFVLTSAPIIKVTVLTVSDPTWTAEDRTKSIEFIATGAGGGGGGVDGQGAGTSAVSGSGAAGATAIKLTNIVDASYAVVIGASGAGGATGNNAGSGGGTTTVISASVNMSAVGGTGGLGDSGISGDSLASGVIGGTATGGDTNIDGGGTMSSGIIGGVAAGNACGGASFWGGGARGRDNATGNDSATHGAGGGGVSTSNISTNFSGGAGADGIVIIKEYS